MDRLVYTALSGLRSNMAAQDVTAHNIANASTLGSNRDVAATHSRTLAGGERFQSRIQAAAGLLDPDLERSEARRVGNRRVRTFTFRWSPAPQKITRKPTHRSSTIL